MEGKILTFATKFEADNTFDNDRFIKLRVWVMHDGKNLNGSTFSTDAIEKARPTLANIPILANVIEKEDGTYDFGGHDYKYENKNGEFVITYLEQPIGVIPETNNYELVEKDGKTYVVADCFIWKDYVNRAQDLILEAEKFDVSMEVLVSEYSIGEDKSFNIDGYKYTGVTFLGSDKEPAMVGANAELVKFSVDQVAQKVSVYTTELAKFFAKEDEEEVKEEMAEEPEVDNPEEKEDMGCGDKDKYEITMEEKRDKLNDSLTSEVVRDENGCLVSETSYWVSTFSDDYAYVTIWEYTKDAGYSDKIVRAKYNVETLTVDKSTFEQVFVQYLTQAEIDLVDASRKSFETQLEEYKSTIEEMDAKFTEMNNEIAVLSEFKAQVEAHSHKCEVDEKLSEFEHELCNNDEFKALKVIAETMSVSDIEKECFAIVGRNNHKPPVKTKKTNAFSFVSVDDTSKGRYGSCEKYFTNK